MIRGLLLFLVAFMVAPTRDALAQQKAFHVLALYSKQAETDHVQFAQQAIRFFNAMATRNNFELTASDQWDDLNAKDLFRYQVIIWLNDSPQTEEQRKSFEHYMTHGGGWLGFHASAYNDKDTHWPWFVDFLGGAVFYGNSWPPLPASPPRVTRHRAAKELQASITPEARSCLDEHEQPERGAPSSPQLSAVAHTPTGRHETSAYQSRKPYVPCA